MIHKIETNVEYFPEGDCIRVVTPVGLGAEEPLPVGDDEVSGELSVEVEEKRKATRLFESRKFLHFDVLRPTFVRVALPSGLAVYRYQLDYVWDDASRELVQFFLEAEREKQFDEREAAKLELRVARKSLESAMRMLDRVESAGFWGRLVFLFTGREFWVK